MTEAHPLINQDEYEVQQKQKRINYGMVFNTEHGQRVLEDLRNFCHANHPTYCPGDSHETAFREGNRNVYLYINDMLKPIEERDDLPLQAQDEEPEEMEAL